MVDLTLTDEQTDLRELAHNFAEKEIRPVAWDYDRDSTWPQEIVEKAWEVGLMNTHIPEEYGGPGLDYFTGALIEEELGWGCSGVGTSLICNGLASAPLLIGASDELKAQGVSILLSEQNMHFAELVSDRAYVLEKGQIRYQASMAELAANEEVRRAYLSV